MGAMIYCYSATGNSLYVAKMIAEGIHAELQPITTQSVVCDSTVIGIVYPAFFWGMPLLVEDFIKKLIITAENPYIFAVYTYGGGAPFSAGQLSKCLKKKGKRLSYAVSVKSVESYIPSFRIKDSVGLWEKVQKKTGQVISNVKKRKRQKFQIHTVVNTIYHHQYPAYNSNCDTYFSISKNCVGCGLCDRICPVDNIEIQNRRPQFLHHCDHCLSCLNHCPEAAIDWNGKTAGKDRYRNSHVGVKELVQFRKKKEECSKPKNAST